MIDYAKLRAALDAGPTPGPWKVSSMSDYPSAIYGSNGQEVLSGCGCCGSPNLAKKDADHIAACDPETIRALLAERDALREALKCIAQTQTKPGDDKAAPLLASVINLAFVALAQEQGEQE